MKKSLFAAALFASSLPTARAESNESAWEKLKSIVGTWQGTMSGQPAHVTYQMVSSGTAVMETIEGPDATQMVTIYHPDGNSLLMTHYCSMGNQPRMRATALKDGKLAFTYVDAANLKSPEADRMSGLVLTFPDSDHLVQEWTMSGGGKKELDRFEFARKK